MRQVITFTMKPEDYAALKAHAAALDMSAAAFIKQAIAAEMKLKKAGGKRRPKKTGE